MNNLKKGILVKMTLKQLSFKNRIIRVANRRIISELVDGRIEITLYNLTRYIVDIPYEEFCKIDRENKIVLRRAFEYYTSYLVCTKCKGKGKIDWIEKITGNTKKIYDLNDDLTYQRNTKVTNLFSPIKSIVGVKAMYVSEPIIFDGEEICPVCKGSGAYALRRQRFLAKHFDDDEHL